jgi:hypothetical protein
MTCTGRRWTIVGQQKLTTRTWKRLSRFSSQKTYDNQVQVRKDGD